MADQRKAQNEIQKQIKDSAGMKQGLRAEREDDSDYKAQVPPEFVPTELGSAVFASIEGSPADEEFLIEDKDSSDDIEDGSK